MPFLGLIAESTPVDVRTCTVAGETVQVVSTIAANLTTATGAQVIEEPEVKVADAA
jgi:hypothetical protein